MTVLPDNHLISIIMPAYNVEEYIRATIDSVVNQTYKNWELIIIDDGSTDNTASIIKDYVKKESRIKYLFQPNSKQAIARNYGISFANGTILAFLDSDDLWLPYKLEKSLNSFESDTYDLLFTESYIASDIYIDTNTKSYSKMGVKSRVYHGDEGLKAFIKNNQIPILTVLVKKQNVIDIGGFDENLVPAEDYDLWVRLLKSGNKFIAIDEALSIYRLQQNSSTANDRLATRSVINCLIKNFNKEEIIKLNASSYINSWIKRWTRLHLNSIEDEQDFINILKSFNLMNLKTILLAKAYIYTGINYFKNKVINTL